MTNNVKDKFIKQQLPVLQQILGYTFVNANFLFTALVHRSFQRENWGQVEQLNNNEKLELLGDSVLGLLITQHLLQNFTQMDEGQISKLRSRIVNAGVLALVSQKLNLGEFLFLSRGENHNAGRLKPGILADTFEAVLGALYLDGGLEACQTLMSHLYELIPLDMITSDFTKIDKELADKRPLNDWEKADAKSWLQEYTQQIAKVIPQYQVIESSGPDHDKIFKVQVSIKGNVLAVGTGKSIKVSQQCAARIILEEKLEDLKKILETETPL